MLRGPVGSRQLDSMILMGAFKLEIVYDSMFLWSHGCQTEIQLCRLWVPLFFFVCTILWTHVKLKKIKTKTFHYSLKKKNELLKRDSVYVALCSDLFLHQRTFCYSPENSIGRGFMIMVSCFFPSFSDPGAHYTGSQHSFITTKP